MDTEPSTKDPHQLLLDNYRQIAQILFFKRSLIVDDTSGISTKCRIAEVEFYQSPDPYLIQDPQLTTAMRFYFVRKPLIKNDGSIIWKYRKSNFMQLYITCGIDARFNVDPNNYGQPLYMGVLITAIKTPTEYISGASEVVSYILRAANVKSVRKLFANKQLITNNNNKDLLPMACENNNFVIRLEHAIYEETVIYNGPRFGLNLKQETDVLNGRYLAFLMKEFRFVCFPNLIKRNKHLLVVNARINGIPDETIIRDFKLREGLLGRWITQYLKGKTMYPSILFLPENIELLEINMQLKAFGRLTP